MKFVVIAFLLVLANNCFLKAQNIITEEIIYTVTINDKSRHDDHWRRENIPVEDRLNWLKNLFDKIQAYQLTIYHTNTDQPFSKKEVDEIFQMQDTIQLFSPKTKEVTEVTQDKDLIAEVFKIRFKERWIWDAQNGLEKEIIAFAPMFKVVDPEGNYRGDKLLFWIKS